MPATREFKIDPQLSMKELLVALQIDGHLDSATLPHWAEGTSVEELFLALRRLGDGEWLQTVHPDKGVYEACDQWLGDFLAGRPVPTREEADDGDPGADGESTALGILEPYLDGLSASSRKAFLARLESGDFLGKATSHVDSLAQMMAAVYVMEDAEYKKFQKTFTFCDDAFVQDEDLAAISKFFVVDNCPAFFSEMMVIGNFTDRANKRVKPLGTKLKKAIADSKKAG